MYSRQLTMCHISFSCQQVVFYENVCQMYFTFFNFFIKWDFVLNFFFQISSIYFVSQHGEEASCSYNYILVLSGRGLLASLRC